MVCKHNLPYLLILEFTCELNKYYKTTISNPLCNIILFKLIISLI